MCAGGRRAGGFRMGKGEKNKGETHGEVPLKAVRELRLKKPLAWP